MTLNSLLKTQMNRGIFVDRTPVIIEMAPGRFDAVNDILRLQSVELRHTIPAFNQLAVRLPNPAIDLLNARTDIVQEIFFDDEVQFPMPPLAQPTRLFTITNFANLLGQVLPGQNAFQVISGSSPRNYWNRVRARTSRVGASSAPDPTWISTDESRRLVGADKARADGIEGRNVRIATLDTGVPTPMFLPGHPTLGGRVESFHLGPFPRPDRVGHGSHVISTIGGKKFIAPNGLVTEGIAPDSVMASFKVLQTRLGVGTNSDIIKGLEMAMTWKAQLVNMSLGSNVFVPDSPFEKPFQQIIAGGGIPICAAGNAGPDAKTVGTPGGSPNCIGVGSVNRNHQAAGFSSRGPAGPNTKPDVASFGGDNTVRELIYTGTSGASTIDGLDSNKFDELGPAMGTSMACPTFTGLAALWDEWLQVNRNRRLTFTDVQEILRRNGGTKNNNIGYGVAQYDWVKVL